MSVVDGRFMFYERVTCKVRDLEINARDWNYTQLKHQQCPLLLRRSIFIVG